jgi:hypothetical protein
MGRTPTRAFLSRLSEDLGLFVLAGKEVLVQGQVDPAEVRRIREHFGFLEDRRPGLYMALEGEGD